jgi:dihydroneopterin aldolase
MEDAIIVSRLELLTHVGVPDAERSEPQRVTVSLRLIPFGGLSALDDELSHTIDYAEVCEAVRIEAAAKPRHLIETLADEIASLLLSRFTLRAVEIDLRKYILPNAEYAAIHIRRESQRAPLHPS